MQLIAALMACGIQPSPGRILQTGCINHDCIPFPMSGGVPHESGFDVGGMGPPVHREDQQPLDSDTKDMGLLRLEHISKDYVTDGASVHALRNVTLEVARGEFVALVGRSGCGKSTLLNLAGCMDFPSSGNVILEGVTTSSLNEVELTKLRGQKVGFIFQSFQLLPTLSVAENVELPLMLAGGTDARSRALECLRWVEMERYEARRPFQLSGGEMQRVAIARALVHSPSLLLADEPTGNLDTGTSVLILDILRRVNAEKNTTILMATHSTEAAATADTIITLRDGSIQDSFRPSKGSS